MDTDDIGLDFSGWNLDEVTTVDISTDEVTVEQLKKRLQQAEQLIMPLLENLLETADKAYIHWPNRKSVLEQKIKEFKQITNL